MNSNIDVRAMLPVGTVLQGRYRIEQYLASGGFGNTYKAIDTNWNEVVAVKEFFMRGVSQREDDSITVSVSNPISSGVFEAQKDKFRKEAVRLRKLRNDHIVEVKDRFDENGTAYYVMDYIEGQSLRDVVSQQGSLTEQQVRQYLDQVLEALEVVHREGMLHLDIKPANIMVSKNVDGSMRVRLIDFGASKQQKAEGGATSTSALSYTTGYAPLEQKDQQFDNFGPWTDFYALGATLYNVLTAQLPPTPTDITDYGIDAFRFPATMSQQMQQLIAWMMTNRRCDRPQSVEQVREFLGKSVAPQPPSPPQPSQDEETVLNPKPLPPPPSHDEKTVLNPELLSPPPSHDDEETLLDPEPLPPVPDDTASLSSRRWLFVGLGVALLDILALIFALPKGESEGEAIPLCPDDNHPHVIDLGLPSGTKWACCNVGASKPEDYGDYFAWGETSTKSNYDWSTYSWCNGSSTTLTKYNNKSSNGTVDNKTQLELSDDAACARLGGSWRMPTIAEQMELKDNCTYEWTTINGVKGAKFTSRNGRSVFLPAAGGRWGSLLSYAGPYGYYWSSTLNDSTPDYAWGLYFDSSNADWGCGRYYGQSVRPVLRN